MIKGERFLWLEGIFEDETVRAFKAISAASNLWQKGFVKALLRSGAHVEILGYPVERVWPFGRLLVRTKHASILRGFDGVVTSYINLPAVRGYIQYRSMLDAANRSIRSSVRKPDWLVVFSCLVRAEEETPAIRVAKYVREHYGIPWICIVADGATPAGADRYVYLPWSNFQLSQPSTFGIHIDGGIAEIGREGFSVEGGALAEAETKVLMYMGALTEHGGVTQLARAFTRIETSNVQLWVCGRGTNSELNRLASTDSRIKLKGFVETEELDRLAQRAFAFVNPRPTSFAPNRLNYPSKLLHYLAYGKPILSTFTEGVSPEYTEILVLVEDGSEAALEVAMRRVLSLQQNDYDDICRRIERFKETHTWTHQVNRFKKFLLASDENDSK